MYRDLQQAAHTVALLSKGAHHIPAAIKVFLGMTWAQLPAQLGPCRSFIPLERVQFKFLRTSFQVLPCVSNMVFHHEPGLLKIETSAWIYIYFHQVKTLFFPVNLTPLIMEEPGNTSQITTLWLFMAN